MPPADPDTMMTAMVKAKIMMDNVSQSYVIFTADQQLYRISLHFLWENQALFKDFYIRFDELLWLYSDVDGGVWNSSTVKCGIWG
jgi:hypothetical protein